MSDSIGVSDLKKIKITFLFVTAAEPEKEALLKALTPLPGEKELLRVVGKNQSYDVGILGRYSVAHVFCEDQGSVKAGASILTIQEAIDAIKPVACVMVGIAYGAYRDKQKIGDVLISECVQPYDSIRVSTDENNQQFDEDRNKVQIPGHTIRNQFVNFQCGNKDYNVWHGTFLSGEKLIDNTKYKEELIKSFSIGKKSNKKIIGGEMEGVGLSSTFARNDNSNWIIVKAICDWADGNKRINKKKKQEKAANNAVDFCLELFSTNLLCQIKGVKIEKKEKTMEPMVIINPYVMFYYRNICTLSFKRLAEKSKVFEEDLRNLENVKEKSDKKYFHKVPRSDYEKIKETLKCDDVLRSETVSEKMIKFYNRYKGKGRFYPVDEVKVVVFDFDGTLTKTTNNYSTWQLIWLYLKYSLDDCGRYHRKYVNGEITHQEWCDITAEQFIEKGLSVDDVEEVSNQISLIDGTIETIKKIKGKGVKVYICSGAVKDVIENVFGEDFKLFDGVVCNEFTYDRKGKLNSIKGTKYDYDGKATYIKKIIKENKIEPEECLFVGNSDNDIAAYKSGAKTLVINPHKTTGMDRKIWKYYMEEVTNLYDILPFIFPYGE